VRRGLAGLAALLLPATLGAQQVPVISWAPHDTTRPRPPVVQPGPPPVVPQPAPADAIVLFDGSSTAQWRAAKGGPVPWRVVGGALEVVPHSGDIETVQGFGDCQLHVEWATPTPPEGHDQERGNSGVYLMGLYEIQVLDSYDNRTYADGMAGAVFGQYPPLVNASRPPGQWQSYDIVFHRPRFAAGGALQRPATVTVFHNGVLVQDHVVLTGPTAFGRRPPYHAHAARLPLLLQDHGLPVRFRNIWIRDLEAP
jgi:3-keto-disaccharide hydrolase